MRELLGGLAAGSVVIAAGFAACGNESSAPGAPDAAVDSASDGPPEAPLDALNESPKDALVDVALGDSGLPVEHEWLADPAVWKQAPGNENWAPDCLIFEGDPAKLQFKPLEWKPCGAGCVKAEVLQGFAKATFAVASTAALATEATAHLMFDVGVEGATKWFVVRRVIDLSSSSTVAAVEQAVMKGSSACVFGNGRDDALASTVIGDTKALPFTWLPSDATWHWALPARTHAELPAGRVEFTIDAPTSARFQTGKGSVAAMLDPDKNEWTVLEKGSKSQLGSGQGDLALWTDYPTATTERVRGWAPDAKGIRTLVEPVPFDTCTVTTSPSHIVGIVSDNCSSWGNLRLWKAPRSSELLSTGPDVSPALAFGAHWNVKSWGDFAATLLTQPDDGGAATTNSLLVVQLSTWKAWRLDPAPGAFFHNDAYTLTPTAAFIGEVSAANKSTLAAIRRVDFANLDDAATPL